MKCQFLISEPCRLCFNSPLPSPLLKGFTFNEKLNCLLPVINKTFKSSLEIISKYGKVFQKKESRKESKQGCCER